MSTDSWINLSISISTFLAVIVALFGENIRARLFSPRLSIAVKKTAEKNRTNKGEEIWYYHLVISNQRKAIANNVIVMLTQIENNWDGGKQSIWTGEVPLSWMFGLVAGNIFRNIGSSQYCDLIAVGKETGAFLEPLITPNNLHFLWKDKMNITLTICVKSDQNTTLERKFMIAWDGLWDQGETEMAKHLVIKALPELTK